MKTQIVRLFATLSLLLTCFLGTALAQNTNAPTASSGAIHVNQRYNHKEGVVTYYLVFAQTPESASATPYSDQDMASWAVRILDAIDKDFGDRIFKLKVPDHPTPKERKIAETDFLPRAVGVADKWLKEQELSKTIRLVNLDFEAAGTVPKDKGSGKAPSGNTGGVTLGK